MSEPISVVIVEDSPTQALQLEFILSQNGFDVRTAFNGDQALSLMRESVPELVVTDIVMPGMDGYELCRRIKDEDKWLETPVVLLTSLSDPIEAMRAINAGADAFLTKPYKEQFLLRRLNHVVENRRLRDREETGEGVRVTFGDEIFILQAQERQVVELLLSTYEDAVYKQQELARLNRELSRSLEVNKALQKNYLSALENSADSLVIVGADNTVCFANGAARDLFGPESDGLVGHPFVLEIDAGDVVEFEIPRVVGGARVAEARVSETFWEGERALLASLRDVTSTVALRDRLENMAFSDELTGLVNRRGLLALSSARCSNLREDGKRFVVFFVDLDGLKWINDNLGHADGDQAIKDAGDILRQSFRKSDIVARLGGDEFAAVAMDLVDGGETEIRSRIATAMAVHNEHKGRPYQVAMSIGMVSSDVLKGDVETLLEAADALMYKEKQAKKLTRGERPGGGVS